MRVPSASESSTQASAEVAFAPDEPQRKPWLPRQMQRAARWYRRLSGSETSASASSPTPPSPPSAGALSRSHSRDAGQSGHNEASDATGRSSQESAEPRCSVDTLGEIVIRPRRRSRTSHDSSLEGDHLKPLGALVRKAKVDIRGG